MSLKWVTRTYGSNNLTIDNNEVIAIKFLKQSSSIFKDSTTFGIDPRWAYLLQLVCKERSLEVHYSKW